MAEAAENKRAISVVTTPDGHGLSRWFVIFLRPLRGPENRLLGSLRCVPMHSAAY